jgi:hypothetical protein
VIWTLSYRADPFARRIADRHYSRQSIGAAQFVPPGRCVVLTAEQPCGQAYWVTSWPFAEFTKHKWAGAWVCSAFRNEGASVASSMIREALAATRFVFGDPPPMGLVTFVRPSKVQHKRQPGRCFLLAGGKYIGRTKRGLLAIGFSPDVIPPAASPLGVRADLFAEVA